MTRQLDVDRLMEDWLAEGPDHLPDRAVEAIVGQLDTMKQRKPLRLPGSERMHRLIYSVTGVAAGLAVAALALSAWLGGSNQPAGPPGVLFESERHGYELLLPSDRWRVREHVGTWQIGDFFDPMSNGVDELEPLADDGSVDESGNRVYLSSQPIPSWIDDAQWLESHDRARAREQPCFELQGEYREAFVDGEPARVGDYVCGAFDVPWPVVEVVFTHAGRGYALYLMPYDTADGIPIEQIRQEAANWLGRFSFPNAEGAPDA